MIILVNAVCILLEAQCSCYVESSTYSDFFNVLQTNLHSQTLCESNLWKCLVLLLGFSQSLISSYLSYVSPVFIGLHVIAEMVT